MKEMEQIEINRILFSCTYIKKYKNYEIYKNEKNKYIIYSIRENRILDAELDNKADVKELIKML